MPTYSYECRNPRCKDSFSAVDIDKRITDDSEELCLKCKRPMTRLISTGVGIAFKGRGFHVNDYPRS